MAQGASSPPFTGIIETTFDALLIFEAARRGMIPRITRRLTDKERSMIRSGAVFVFDEGESGIKRWTDGLIWSPSRILSNFLVYRETDKRADRVLPKEKPTKSKKSKQTVSASPSPPTPAISLSACDLSSVAPSSSQTSSWRSDADQSTQYPPSTSILFADDDDDDVDDKGIGGSGSHEAVASGSGLVASESLSPAPSRLSLQDQKLRERQLVGSLTTSYKFKPAGLVKKTMSVIVNGYAQHLVSYYSLEDALAGRLRAPSTLPELAALEICADYLSNKQFRYPPKVESGPDGVLRYRGEPDEPDPSPPLGTSPLASTSLPLLSPTGSLQSWPSSGVPTPRSWQNGGGQAPPRANGSPYSGPVPTPLSAQEWEHQHRSRQLSMGPPPSSSTSYQGYPQSPSLPQNSPVLSHAPPSSSSYSQLGHSVPRPIETRPNNPSPQMHSSTLSNSRSSYGSRSGRMYHPYASLGEVEHGPPSAPMMSPRYANFSHDRPPPPTDEVARGRAYSGNGHGVEERVGTETDPSHLSYHPEGHSSRSSSSAGIASPVDASMSYYPSPYAQPSPSDYAPSPYAQVSPHQSQFRSLPHYSQHSSQQQQHQQQQQQHHHQQQPPYDAYYHHSREHTAPSPAPSSYRSTPYEPSSYRTRYASYSHPVPPQSQSMYGRRPSTVSADPRPLHSPHYDHYRVPHTSHGYPQHVEQAQPHSPHQGAPSIIASSSGGSIASGRFPSGVVGETAEEGTGTRSPSPEMRRAHGEDQHHQLLQQQQQQQQHQSQYGRGGVWYGS